MNSLLTSQLASDNRVFSTTPISQSFACPHCKTRLNERPQTLVCLGCKQEYLVQDGIPVFAEKRGYWCNVSREKMQSLIQEAESTGDWLSATEKHIARYAPHVVPLFRADAQFLWPITSESRVLDAGSMWGGLTIPIAQYAKEVYALDQTWETLRFLQVRAKQMGLNNVIAVESSIHALPFPDQFFDFVILNGVLEWLGMEQDVILEAHWDKKRKDAHTYKQSPQSMQLYALKELYRVLKPGGGIYVAIENRIGLQYFLGHPDDHVNLRFTPFLPRFLANAITRYWRNMDYRTYIYTPEKLKQLVETAGFTEPMLFTAYPHYGKISRLIPFSIFSHLKSLSREGYAHFKVFALTCAWKLIPAPLAKYMAPSLALIAGKEKLAHRPRLLQLLIEGQLLTEGQATHCHLALINNRFGNDNSTNYLVYDNKNQTELFFCKISRNKSASALLAESAQLADVSQAVQGGLLAHTIPEIVLAQTIDGITIQVAKYVKAKHVSNNILNGLRLLPRYYNWSTKPKLMQWLAATIQHGARKLWLRHIDATMLSAIDWLVQFQQATKTSSITLADYVQIKLAAKLPTLVERGLEQATSQAMLAKLMAQIMVISTQSIPIVSQHGDFDICNVLRRKQGIFIVDFEHVEYQTSPFFDLANLVFSPLLTEWQACPDNVTLADYARATGWLYYITKWLHHYATLSGMDKQVLAFLPQFAAIEQNSKCYPEYRNPSDYPMYGKARMQALLTWDLTTSC